MVLFKKSDIELESSRLPLYVLSLVRSFGSVMDRLWALGSLLSGVSPTPRDEVRDLARVGGLRFLGAALILSCAAWSPSMDEAWGSLSKLTAATKETKSLLMKDRD